MSPIRPDLALLWQSFTVFPLFGLGILVIGSVGSDGVMIAIGLGLLVLNGLMVLNHAYFTTVTVEAAELVHRTMFGSQIQRIPIGSIQRIDAKRYPGAHSGVSAPFFVARGRTSTLKVNTKPYRLEAFRSLIDVLRTANSRIELDPFWQRVAEGADVSKEVALTPRSRW